MPRLVRIPLEPGSTARLEIQRSTRAVGGWFLALVVPEQELARFGEGSVLDLLDLADELEDSILRTRAA